MRIQIGGSGLVCAPLDGFPNNRAVVLDGNGDYIKTGLDTEYTFADAYTVMAWVWSDVLPGTAGRYFSVVAKAQDHNDLDFQVQNNNGVYFYTDSSSATWFVPDPAAVGLAVYTSAWSNVTSNGSLFATFAENLAALGTPEWWLAQWGLTNGGTTFDEAETNDVDGLSAREEYIADSVPTNKQSSFALSSIEQAGGWAVSFACSSTRVYSLMSALNLVEGSWSFVEGASNVPGSASGSMTLTDSNDAPYKVFRASVRIP